MKALLLRMFILRMLALASILGLLSTSLSAAEPNLLGNGLGVTNPSMSDSAGSEAMAKWARSCALCHITGEANAPVVGDTEEWQQRLQKGEAALLNNVVNGINSMPPLGYCMSCEAADFRVMIDFMAGVK
ncbi:MAG: cytochrome c5 family protein [Gammaproteobacteria bacterium]|jgi:cytochrome c5|nr:cytochrome c5 family protein [Gammaproteobacteria bacterium]|tara:strand:+ start:128 stop:517 length:390 start_codon:yes stop_codon:yes gene_type:complete